MNCHQSNVFLQDHSIFFRRWFNLYNFHSECLNNSWWCFSSSFSDFEDRRRFSLNLAPFSSRFMALASCHPLIIVSVVRISFHPSGAFQGYFQFDYPESIISEDLFILSFQLSFSKSYRCIVQISSNQFMISSFHLYLNSFKYLRSFSNSSRCFAIFSLFVSILTVVHSRFLFLRYHINSFVVLIPLVFH